GLGRARVESDPHLQGEPGGGGYSRGLEGAEVELGGDGGVEGIRGSGKGGAEGVADRLEDLAVVRLNRGVEAGVVSGEGEAHGVGVLLPELGAPLDVGEQEGDRAGGQVSHPRAPPAPRRLRPLATSPVPPPTPPRTPVAVTPRARLLLSAPGGDATSET